MASGAGPRDRREAGHAGDWLATGPLEGNSLRNDALGLANQTFARRSQESHVTRDSRAGGPLLRPAPIGMHPALLTSAETPSHGVADARSELKFRVFGWPSTTSRCPQARHSTAGFVLQTASV